MKFIWNVYVSKIILNSLSLPPSSLPHPFLSPSDIHTYQHTIFVYFFGRRLNFYIICKPLKCINWFVLTNSYTMKPRPLSMYGIFYHHWNLHNINISQFIYLFSSWQHLGCFQMWALFFCVLELIYTSLISQCIPQTRFQMIPTHCFMKKFISL